MRLPLIIALALMLFPFAAQGQTADYRIVIMHCTGLVPQTTSGSTFAPDAAGNPTAKIDETTTRRGVCVPSVIPKVYPDLDACRAEIGPLATAYQTANQTGLINHLAGCQLQGDFCKAISDLYGDPSAWPDDFKIWHAANCTSP